MTFDNYPSEDGVLDLAPGAVSAGQPITSLRFGPDRTMYLRVVQLAAGPPAPPPELALQAGTGPMVVVPRDGTVTDLPGSDSPGASIVANADLVAEPNAIYRIRVFPADIANPPQQMALRLKNNDSTARAFRWVVADSLADSAQPRVALPTTTHLEVISDREATTDIEVRNRGTAELRITAAAGTDLGAGFTLTQAPAPVPANSVSRLRIGYKPPPLSPGATAVASTTHFFPTNDPIAQRPGRRDAFATITANVRAPRWRPGDVLVVDPAAGDGASRGALIRVDPATGRQSIVSNGKLFVSPAGVALDSAGHALIADSGAVDGNGAIIRVDRVTGEQTVLSSGQRFRDPNALVVTPQGRIVVTDLGAANGAGALIEVNPANGNQTVFAAGDNLLRPFNLAVDDPATGSLVALNLVTAATTPRAVKIAPNGTKTAFTVDSGAAIGIAVDQTRRVVLVVRDFELPPALVAYRPNGVKDTVSTGQRLRNPIRLRRDGPEHVLVTSWVAERNEPAELIRIRLSDGQQSLLTANGMLRNPMDLVVVPGTAPGGL